jgi:Flp pilus assembly protein TadB
VSAGAPAWSPVAWAAWSLLATGLVGMLLRLLRRDPVPDRSGLDQGRLASWYGRTRGGRRLHAQLGRAMIATTPARWRAGQMVLAVPASLALVAALGPGTGIGLGVGAVRVGGRLMLSLRSGRRAAELERAAPDLARTLSAELSAGVSTEEALAAAGRALCGSHPVLAPVLGTALRWTAAGEGAGAALTAALATEPEAEGADHLVAVAVLLSLQGRAGGDPLAFERLARAQEAAVAMREDARAVTAEARMAATAVPALSGALGLALVVTHPPIAAGLQSPLAAGALTCCILTAVAAAALARRLAAVT